MKIKSSGFCRLKKINMNIFEYKGERGMKGERERERKNESE